MSKKNDTYPGGYKKEDFFNWITWDEAVQNKITTEYETCDKYVENNQAPDYVPEKLTYIEENLCLDLVAGYTGQLAGGKIGIDINNAEAIGEMLSSVIEDIIFRANKFNKKLFMPLTWKFYQNGIGGISIQYNSFKKSIYGIGVPEIFILRWKDILLDANSRGGMHYDDKRRGIRKRVRVDYAKRKYPKFADKITAVGDDNDSSETDKYCNIYNYEYVITEFKKDEFGNRIEEDVFYTYKTINKDLLVEPPRKTGYNQFMLVIPAIHTGREHTCTWPMGAVLPVTQTQNEINQVKSVMLEQIKHSIKNFLIILNARGADEAKIRSERAKVNGVAVLEGNNVQVETPNKDEIAVALIQWYEYLRKAFDEVSGRYAPERGATEGDLSGKAIALLQNRGSVPENVRKVNMENALTDMTTGILECVAKRMHTQPFKINKKIEGTETDIYFNYPLSQMPEDINFDSPYINVTDSEGMQVVNDLRKVDVDKIDINVEVKMDLVGSETQEANKALIARQQGGISLKDLVKKLYPDNWKEMYDNVMTENEVMQVMNELQEMEKESPEIYGGLVQKMNVMIKQGKKFLEMEESK